MMYNIATTINEQAGTTQSSIVDVRIPADYFAYHASPRVAHSAQRLSIIGATTHHRGSAGNGTSPGWVRSGW